MATEADRLLAEGKTITLTNGEVVRVRYGMRGLKMLEDQFGSIGAAIDETRRKLVEDQRLIEPTLDFLIPGLLEYRDENKRPLYDEEALLDLLDSTDLREIVSSAMDALMEAMPSVDRTESDESETEGNLPARTEPGELSTPASTGSPATTSQPSSLDAAMAHSGV